MKRTACAIIMIFVSLLILSSCSEKSGSVYLIDVSDGLSDGAVNIKVDEKIRQRSGHVLYKLRLASLMVNAQKVCFLNSKCIIHAHTSKS